jgi:hypothetical protein
MPMKKVAQETRLHPIGFGSTLVPGHSAAHINVEVPFDAEIARIEIPMEICEAFLVTDIKIGGNDQLRTPGALPASVFADNDRKPWAPDFDCIRKGQFLTIGVQNQSSDPIEFQAACLVRKIEVPEASVTKSAALAPFWKSFTFWIAMGLWAVTVGGHYAQVIPPPYGLLVGNAVAAGYAILRCLQKRAAGVPWKGIVATSEFMITVITVLVNTLESLSALPAMSPKALAGISAGIAILVSLLHTLAGRRGNQSGIPVVSADDIDTAVEGIRARNAVKPERKDPPS